MNVNEDAVAGLVDTEVEKRILAKMQKRADLVSERSQKRRMDKPGGKAESETADSFTATFMEMKVKIDRDLEVTEGLTDDKDKLMEHLSTLQKDHSALQQFLSESSMFLPAFQKKKSQDHLSETDSKIRAQMDAFQPKKRFGFNKKKPSKLIEKPIKPAAVVEKPPTNASSNSFLDNLIKKNFFGFKDKTDETLVMEPSELLDRQLNLQNLTNCTVKVLGSPGAIQAANLVNCKVFIGPTSRSAFVKQSTKCVFVLACQQLRVHDTCDTQFYVHVTGSAIIESCKQVGFAPYNLDYVGLDLHYLSSGLDRANNMWDQAQDFSWISKNEKSPNMFIIEESDRKSDWLCV